MPAKKPRTKPPAERRDELLQAAVSLFLEQGPAATTIEQITARARIAKGTFYLYFQSKDDVLTALAARYGEDLLATIKPAVEKRSAQDWRGKLAVWARATVSAYLDSIRLHDIVFYGTHHKSHEGAVDNVIVDHLCDLLRGGAAAGAWSLDDPRATAVFLFAGVHGVVDDAHIKEHRVNRSRLAQRLESLCLRAVGLR